MISLSGECDLDEHNFPECKAQEENQLKDMKVEDGEMALSCYEHVLLLQRT